MSIRDPRNGLPSRWQSKGVSVIGACEFPRIFIRRAELGKRTIGAGD